jgi:hypothetical protein
MPDLEEFPPDREPEGGPALRSIDINAKIFTLTERVNTLGSPP